MTTDELETYGLYQCPDCDRTYDSEKALVFCCQERYDQPSFVRSYN